jgi:hypothetical protein
MMPAAMLQASLRPGRLPGPPRRKASTEVVWYAERQGRHDDDDQIV